MAWRVHVLTTSRIVPGFPHEGDCAGTQCEACGCCGHCAEDGHCPGELGCDDEGCGCFFEFEDAQ
jgi:hypothetical protein